MTEYILYRAKIEGNRSSQNRFPVRILPDMADIQEKENLPDYPCFFSTEQYAYTEGDVVWAICDEDFQIGYILGPCEPSIGSGYEPFLRRINDVEKQAQLPMSAPENLTFTQIMDVALDFYNRANKQCGRILTNGAVIIYGFDGSIYVQNPQANIMFTKEGNVSIKAKALSQEITNMDVHATEVKEAFNTLATTVDGNAKVSVGGTYQIISGANRTESTLGTHDITTIGKKRETIGQGERKRIVTGGSSTLALAGNIESKALLGSVNSEGVEINLTGGTVTILGGVINLKGQVIQAPAGSVLPSFIPGPFCALPVCPVTGLPHSGSTFTSIDPTVLLQLAAEMITLPPT